MGDEESNTQMRETENECKVKTDSNVTSHGKNVSPIYTYDRQ